MDQICNKAIEMLDVEDDNSGYQPQSQTRRDSFEMANHPNSSSFLKSQGAGGGGTQTNNSSMLSAATTTTTTTTTTYDSDIINGLVKFVNSKGGTIYSDELTEFYQKTEKLATKSLRDKMKWLKKEKIKN